jgi:hypothetical protein
MRFVAPARRLRSAGLLAAMAAAASCTREPTASLPTVADVIADVVLASDPSLHAILTAGQAPNSGGSGGTLSIQGPLAVINGGSAQVQVTNATAFQTVVILVAGRPDYYVLNLPAPVTSAAMLVSLSAGLNTSFQWVWGVGADAGSAGNYTGASVTFVPVLSGDVQVSIAWDSPADVDLHVVEPGTEEIYYGNLTSAAGGVLDLDSNAACGSDGPRNENITYPSATPPAGAYIVRVDHWSNCGATATNYIVTIRVKGHALQTFTGQFTGAGDAGGAGSGVTIGTGFTFP